VPRGKEDYERRADPGPQRHAVSFCERSYSTKEGAGNQKVVGQRDDVHDLRGAGHIFKSPSRGKFQGRRRWSGRSRSKTVDEEARKAR